MDAGEYMILADPESGYFAVTNDANGEDIIFNGNFETNTIITVNDGEYCRLSDAIAVKIDEFYDLGYTIKTDADGIMIKVGNEIDAGEYLLEGEDGYYCIYSSSRQDDIISNGRVEGSGYIEVQDGQYLKLNRCVIKEKTN